MLWILALAKTRSAVPISAAISAKRATQTNSKINATLVGARQKDSWLRRSFVTARCRGMSLTRSLPSALLPLRATHPGISNSLLGDEEVLDCFGDFFGMCFQREVAGVEETDGGIWNVAFEGLGT